MQQVRECLLVNVFEEIAPANDGDVDWFHVADFTRQRARPASRATGTTSRNRTRPRPSGRTRLKTTCDARREIFIRSPGVHHPTESLIGFIIPHYLLVL
jgi:hypothetical protein